MRSALPQSLVAPNVYQLVGLGVEFASIEQAMDLSTTQGRLTLYVFAMLAEIERDMIAQRVKAGLAATRARGIVLGRPPKAVNPSALAELLAEGHSRAEIGRRLRVSRRTIGRVLSGTCGEAGGPSMPAARRGSD